MQRQVENFFKSSKSVRLVRLLGLLLLVVSISGCVLKRPSNDRPWCLEHAVLPQAVFHGDQVEICNVRNFRHVSETKMYPNYYHKSLDLRSVETVDLFICYSGSDESLFAHTMLSFGTSGGGDYLAISVEARREVDEKFGPLRAAAKQLELIYVIGDERDVIDQRVVARGETLYRYPIQVPPYKARALLVALLQQANELRCEPEFYQLLRNNCTSNLLEHAGDDAGGPLTKHKIATFPGYADVILRRLSLIDSSLPINQQRACVKVNPRAVACRNSPDYSRCIRRRY